MIFLPREILIGYTDAGSKGFAQTARHAERRSLRFTVNGQLSLCEARFHYAACGASDPRFLPYVQKPS
jgi:hypothetical protein